MAPSCPGPGAGPRCPCAQGRGGLTPVPEPTGRGSAISSLPGAGPQGEGSGRATNQTAAYCHLGRSDLGSPTHRACSGCLGSYASGSQHSVHSEYTLTQLSSCKLAAHRAPTERADANKKRYATCRAIASYGPLARDGESPPSGARRSPRLHQSKVPVSIGKYSRQRKRQTTHYSCKFTTRIWNSPCLAAARARHRCLLRETDAASCLHARRPLVSDAGSRDRTPPLLVTPSCSQFAAHLPAPRVPRPGRSRPTRAHVCESAIPLSYVSTNGGVGGFIITKKSRYCTGALPAVVYQPSSAVG